MANYLTAERILSIHETLVRIFADIGEPIVPPGPRDENLVHSAAARPQTAIGKTEKYPTVVTKAGALFHSLVTSHPFHNGNKRTALISLATFLHENHRRLTDSDPRLYEFVLAVADNHLPRLRPPGSVDAFVAQITDWIERHSTHLSIAARGMSLREFLDKLRAAGARVKPAGNGYLILGDEGRSIRIANSTKQLPGPVVKVYVSKLALSEAYSGISFGEFQAGILPEQTYIQSLMQVLRMLSHV